MIEDCPAPARPPTARIAVLVHPGSLIAAAAEGFAVDWNAIAAELDQFDIVHCVDGGLIPPTGKARHLRYRATHFWNAAPEGEPLNSVGFRIGALHPGQQIIVFGAWGDPESGCAAAVFDSLAAAGCLPVLHSSVPVYDEQEWILTVPRIAMLKALGRWCDCPTTVNSLLDTIGSGALDGGCFLYAEAAFHYVGRSGRIAAVAGSNGVEHFFLRVDPDRGFDGDGVRLVSDILNTQADEGVIQPHIVDFHTIHDARAAARKRGIPDLLPSIPKYTQEGRGSILEKNVDILPGL